MWSIAARVVWGAIAVLTAVPAYAESCGEESPARQAAAEDGRGGALRAFIGRLSTHVNGSYQAVSRRYEQQSEFAAYGEQALFRTRQEFPGGAHVDVGGMLRVWRGLAIGASYTELDSPGSAEATGTVPHPLAFGRDRTARAQSFALAHRQRATHVHLGWRFALRDALDVTFSAGPTYFNLLQGVVTDLTAIEGGGTTFADVGVRAGTGERMLNGVGFNAGVDVTWMLTRRLGIGHFTRVTASSIDAGGPKPFSPERYHVGGVQSGIGLRVRF